MIPLALRIAPAGMASAAASDREQQMPSENDVASTAGEAQSLNGIERVPSRKRKGGSSRKQLASRSQREQGVLHAKNVWLDDLTNKLLPPEETDLMVKRLTKKADEQFRRTYVSGVPTVGIQESAVVLKVGLSFLPGADKPQVNRQEQTDMAEKLPDQKDALWRVNTAGTLLLDHDVAQDLSITQSEKTSNVIKHALQRRQEEDWLFRSQRRTKVLRESPHDAVTIDSSCVKLVSDLRSEKWDLEGMLIEVDGSSLSDLMIRFRHLIAIGGPSMTFAETKMVIELMIEDARRLCLRSPILFRMSTRTRIIRSKITRYGVAHSDMFRTLTVSNIEVLRVRK